MRDSNTFAVALHRRRRDCGLSLGDVANRTNYSASYISKLLHGHRPLLPAVVHELDTAVNAGGELERIAAEQRAGSVAPVRPMQSPPAVAGFIGREQYLQDFTKTLPMHTRPGVAATVVIEGGFWTGKTALAVHWVATVIDRFPGGCLFADLRGFAPGAPADPKGVLEGFLRSLGAGPEHLTGSVDDLAGRFRSLLAQRPAVVLLDNAAGSDQVRPLLPGAGSLAVITSREHQPGILFDTGGLCVDLPALSSEEALTLLRHRLGAARVDAEAQAAEAVVRQCGYLPKAVLIAAEHLMQHPHRSLRDMAEYLGQDRRRLDLLSSSDRTGNIRGVIDLSYLALDPRAARVFRLLGICPAYTVSAESTAALAEIDVDDAQAALDTLLGAHLVERAHAGRVRMNDLLRSYAYERAIVEEHMSEVERAHDRVLRWYAETAQAAGNAIAPDWTGTSIAPGNGTDITPMTFSGDGYDAAMAWCDAEVDTALQVAGHARSVMASDAVWLLPSMFLPYFHLTKNWGAWLTGATRALAAARESRSDSGIARCLQSLGMVTQELGRGAESIDHLTEAMQIHTELGDDLSRAWTAFALAAAYTSLDQHHDARDCYQLAETLFTAENNPFGLTSTRAMLATTYSALGRPNDALRCGQEALSRAQQVPSKPLLGLARHRLGMLLLRQGQPRAALTHLDAALAIRRTTREHWSEAETLLSRAETLIALGEREHARQSYIDAADILHALHDPRALDIHAKVAMLDATARVRNGAHPCY
jgi:tetratricopeptide (TPR) repeat protein/transcriptional regulator with XRE-family HTH domain